MRSHDNFFTTTLIDRQAGTSSRVDNVVKNAICHAHWTGSDPVTTDELGDCTIYGYRNDDNDPADGYITISTSYTDKASTAAPIVIAIKDETGTATANPIHINFEDGRSIDNDGTTSVLISSDHGAMTLYIVEGKAFIEDYYAPSFSAVNEVNVDGVTVTGDGTVSGPLATFSEGDGDEFLADDGNYKVAPSFYKTSETIDGDITATIGSSDSSLTITDSRTKPVGLQYGASYKDDFTDQSLVDKEYVDNTGYRLVLNTEATGDVQESTGVGNYVTSEILNSISFSDSNYVNTDPNNQEMDLSAGTYTVHYNQNFIFSGTGTLAHYMLQGRLLIDDVELKASKNTARIYYTGGINEITVQNEATITVTEGQTLKLQWVLSARSGALLPTIKYDDGGESVSLSIFRLK